jgi:hypothetical protein
MMSNQGRQYLSLSLSPNSIPVDIGPLFGTPVQVGSDWYVFSNNTLYVVDLSLSGGSGGMTGSGGASALIFTSTPPANAVCNTPLRYPLEATGAAPLIFGLSRGPQNSRVANFGSNRAEWSWTPTSSDVGSEFVELQVTDTTGAVTTEQFGLSVTCPGVTLKQRCSVGSSTSFAIVLAVSRLRRKRGPPVEPTPGTV